MSREKTEQILSVLPQTQCGECGFSGCRPYAEALAFGKASIDACPPGGVSTLKILGTLLNEDATPFISTMEAKTRAPMLAKIREKDCIGCTKCIKACPVDAIIGSAQQMHAIIPKDCTGCGLCVPACPVDCIEMETLESPQYDKMRAKAQYEARKIRLLKNAQEETERLRRKNVSNNHENDEKKAYILAALKRVEAKKSE